MGSEKKRCSLDGPASKEWNDGYVQTPYFSGHGAGLHYDINSTSQQNLSGQQGPPAVQEARQPIQRPQPGAPKPRRSESADAEALEP